MVFYYRPLNLINLFHCNKPASWRVSCVLQTNLFLNYFVDFLPIFCSGNLVLLTDIWWDWNGITAAAIFLVLTVLSCPIRCSTIFCLNDCFHRYWRSKWWLFQSQATPHKCDFWVSCINFKLPHKTSHLSDECITVLASSLLHQRQNLYKEFENYFTACCCSWCQRLLS